MCSIIKKSCSAIDQSIRSVPFYDLLTLNLCCKISVYMDTHIVDAEGQILEDRTGRTSDINSNGKMAALN